MHAAANEPENRYAGYNDENECRRWNDSPPVLIFLAEVLVRITDKIGQMTHGEMYAAHQGREYDGGNCTDDEQRIDDERLNFAHLGLTINCFRNGPEAVYNLIQLLPNNLSSILRKTRCKRTLAYQ